MSVSMKRKFYRYVVNIITLVTVIMTIIICLTPDDKDKVKIKDNTEGYSVVQSIHFDGQAVSCIGEKCVNKVHGPSTDNAGGGNEGDGVKDNALKSNNYKQLNVDSNINDFGDNKIKGGNQGNEITDKNVESYHNKQPMVDGHETDKGNDYEDNEMNDEAKELDEDDDAMSVEIGDEKVEINIKGSKEETPKEGNSNLVQKVGEVMPSKGQEAVQMITKGGSLQSSKERGTLKQETKDHLKDAGGGSRNRNHGKLEKKCGHLRHPNTTVFNDEKYVNVSEIFFYPSFVYYDDREPQHYVKFMAFSPEPPPKEVKCRIQFTNGGTEETSEMWVEPSPQLTAPFCYWWASIINCPITEGRVPSLAALARTGETPTEWAKVQIPPQLPKKKKVGFSVCLKGLYEADDTDVGRLMEWFEIYKALGAEKMYLYGVYDSSPSIHTLLAYYAKTGFVEMRQLRMPVRSIGPKHVKDRKWKKDPLTKAARRKTYTAPCIKNFGQHVAYKDCLYRSIGRHEYVFVQDSDEVLIPTEGRTWTQVLTELRSSPLYKNASSYQVKEMNFCDLRPKEPQTGLFLNSLRTARFNQSRYGDSHGRYYKSISDTRRVLNVYTHDATRHVHIKGGGRKRLRILPDTLAVKNHYRLKPQHCKNITLVTDHVMDTHKDKLIKRLAFVTQDLQKLSQTCQVPFKIS